MSESNHVDGETLAMLQEVMEGSFVPLLESYLSDGESRICDLQQAYSDKDFDQLRRTAHSLKGSSGNVGATQMADLCLLVEQRGKEEELEGVDTLLSEIQQEFSTVRGIMSGYL